ncbi:SH3 domain-containing protein [Myroides ceti]|uniref:SH3 domain-containing protein n=1 Tax=Paenimyroides ceti TaxID=395087 RepID=A0ABT8CSH2_9FLAO|nr:SH3 domain-containing protein [Paenimyroides ceti]MDN3707458.1 SH3 domain-containing protein [Paenimyroides ceti]
MEIWKSISSHTSEYENPIKLLKGEIVKLGNRAPEENWKDWIWAENDKEQGGWVPIQIIENLESNKQGLILEDYSAKELNIDKDEIVVKVKSLNGWSWCRKIKDNDEGWIPDEVIDMQ